MFHFDFSMSGEMTYEFYFEDTTQVFCDFGWSAEEL